MRTYQRIKFEGTQEYLSKSRQRKNERGIWQRRFWEHVIRDEEDYVRHVEYIHYNPVKPGYVNQVFIVG